MNTKKQTVFVLSMGIVGVVLSIAIFVVLLAIALPSYINLPLTFEERADYEQMGESLKIVAEYGDLIFIPLLLMALVFLVLLLRVLNPGLTLKAMKGRVPLAKSIIAILALGACLFGAAAMLGELYSVGQGLRADKALWSVVFFAVAWLVAGEYGWSGDLGTWGFGQGTGRRAEIRASLLLGAASGLVAVMLTWLVAWAFMKYFVLVSEVLDGSGETSFKGMVLLFKGMLFFGALSLATFAAAVAALAPVAMPRKARLKALVMPVALAALMCGVIGYVYLDAATRFDLDKASLAEAAGLSTETPKGMTVVTLTNTPSVANWSLEMPLYGFITSDDFMVTEGNILALEQYLKAHPEGTVFQYEAKSAMSQGRFLLWQPEEGRRKLSESVKESIMFRVYLLRHTMYGRVTGENISYLRDFTDEEKWSLGRKSAVQVAQALARMGLLDEAASWREKAIALGAEAADVSIPEGLPVTDGVIRGRVHVGEEFPAGTKVGLFGYGPCDDLPKDPLIDTYSASLRMVDTQAPSASGEFEFTALGEGAYLLGVNAADTVIPPEPEMVSVSGSPGFICINSTSPSFNVGTIDIQVKQR